MQSEFCVWRNSEVCVQCRPEALYLFNNTGASCKDLPGRREDIALNKLDLTNTGDRIFPKILRRQAQQVGDTCFLITDSQRITFAEAESISNSLAAGLQQLGLGRGDRIALYMGNRPEMVLLALAANKLGAVWTPINTDYKGQWLLDTIQRSRVKVLATDDQLQQRIVEIRDQLNAAELILLSDSQQTLLAGSHAYASLAEQAPLELDYQEQSYGDSNAILWTSGTTGKSKGVLQSYNNWIRAIIFGASRGYQSREGDSIYCALPMYNTAAWIACIFRALVEGIPCAIEDKFSVSNFWERVRHFGATQTLALGAMGMFLLNAPARPDDADNPLRVAWIVPMPLDQWAGFEQRFGVRLIRSSLGQSELPLLLTQIYTPENKNIPLHAIGFPYHDTEVRLCDDEGKEVALGEAGEICVKPLQPHVLFNGYFDDPQATAAAFRGDWYLTGDMGRQDPESGAYFFVDRKKDAIRFAGRNISTLEVESVVVKHPAVQYVAAFGIPSQELASEDELKLNIVLHPGQQASHEELCAFINANAPHYFVPRYMEFVDSLPYTPTNKVQKYLLRKQGVTDNTWDLKNSGFKVKR
jgi:crotonobetaine/carnitine-CoA ligase